MKSERKMNDDDLKTLVQETQRVRKLLMLQALAAGYKQKHIAATLGVSPATMNRMILKGLPTLKGAAEN
jgi:FixJ family two-component response regulator